MYMGTKPTKNIYYRPFADKYSEAYTQVVHIYVFTCKKCEKSFYDEMQLQHHQEKCLKSYKNINN